MPQTPPTEAQIAARAEAVALRAKLLYRISDLDGPFYRRLSKCGDRLNLACANCGSGRSVETRCKWKCCPVCARAATAASADRFTRISAKCQWPLMVTFNAEHSPYDDVLAFREMRRALVRFRAQRWWKQRVKGGVAAWEVSRLSTRERRARKLGRDNGWHFHCHTLLDCRWLWISTPPPRVGASVAERNARIKIISDELNAQWTMALGGRRGSLHVRRVWKSAGGGIEGAIHEVLKYAMSGATLAESEWDIEPVLWALEKARMIQGFGSFYRHPDIKRRLAPLTMCECGDCEWSAVFGDSAGSP